MTRPVTTTAGNIVHPFPAAQSAGGNAGGNDVNRSAGRAPISANGAERPLVAREQRAALAPEVSHSPSQFVTTSAGNIVHPSAQDWETAAKLVATMNADAEWIERRRDKLLSSFAVATMAMREYREWKATTRMQEAAE